jgi:hypothetical protein
MTTIGLSIIKRLMGESISGRRKDLRNPFADGTVVFLSVMA